VYSPVPSPTIHGEGQTFEVPETLWAQMLPRGHPPHDGGEDQEVPLFRAQKRLSFEERDHFRQQIVPIAHDEHETRVAVAMVLSDPSAAEPLLNQVEDLTSIAVLTDVELGDELPAGSRTRIPLDGDVE